MKKLSVLLLLILCLAMVSFAGGQGEEKGTKPAAAAADRPKTPVERYNPSYQYPTQKIAFSYWTMMGGRPNFKKYIEKVVEDYQALHPNVYIDVRYIPNQKRDLLDIAAYQANNPGDLHAEHITTALAYGVVDPAPEWVVRYWKENWDEGALQTIMIDGKYWAPPTGNEYGAIGANFLYYNKDYYEKAGIKDPPKTLPELIDIARKTTIRDASGDAQVPGYHMRFEGAKYFVGEKLLPFVNAFMDARKQFLFNEDYTDVLIDTKPFIDALAVYQKMAVEWKVTNPKLPINRDTFILGKNVMMNENAEQTVRIAKSNPGLRYGLAPLVNGAPPYGNNPVGQTKNQLEHIVWKDTRFPDVVWDFSLFMRDGENDLTYAKMMPSFPILKANKDAAFLKEFVWYDVAKVIMYERPENQALYYDPWNMSEQLQTLLGEAVHEVCFDAKADPATVLKAKAARAREKLKAQMEAVKKK